MSRLGEILGGFQRKVLMMDYVGIILVWIAGYLFFSGIKISYIGERTMKFEVTDPTVLWAAVAAILVGLFSIVFAIYKESRHTKEIQETTGILQKAVGNGDTTLRENDRVTHEKIDRLDRNAEKVFSQLDSRTEQGFSKMEQYISAQQALQQRAQNTNMSTAELLAYVEVAATRATEAERFRQERDNLKIQNIELLQLVKQQEHSLQDLKKQVSDLTAMLEQKEHVISKLTRNRTRKSEEHDWDEER